MAETFYYLAYGSNLNLRQMKHRCPNAKRVGKAILKGFELECRNFLTVVKNPNSEMMVGVWEVTYDDLRNLDVYEGYPDFYNRIEVSIDIGVRYVNAYIYMMNGGKMSRLQDSYLEVVKEGYRDFELDTSKLQEAIFKVKDSELPKNLY